MADDEIPHAYWKACFNLAAQSTTGSTASDVQEIDEEKRAWLYDALADYSRNSDPALLMKKHVETLLDISHQGEPNDEQAQLIEQALQALIDLTGDSDLAVNFGKIGGYQLLKWLLRQSRPNLKCQTAELIAELAQNHIQSQQALCNSHIMPVLISLLKSDDQLIIVRRKALYALSCMIRGCLDAAALFCGLGGIKYVVNLLNAEDDQLKAKCCFFLRNLLNEIPQHTDSVVDMSLLSMISCLIEEKDETVQEEAMNLLHTVVSNSKKACLAMNTTDVCLKTKFENLCELWKAEHRDQEKIQLCEEILKLCIPTE
ncbi:Hsp70-binding protein 1 [Trichinella pseudospiralis]|uniref:Hsp70-binding protein 1 n=1 Tax=Trichinella pseudospiralis TaxID=6337 RepID=A0A0V1G140_TRIPS|nr:Hsp70-binding protein 1 [Trichinella pseudospiralis]